MHTGKTTLAERLVKEHGYTRASFAMPLKRLAQEMGVDLKNRAALQAFGHGIREIDPEFWIKAFVHEYEADYPRLVVDDMRYENEYEFLLSNNAVMIRLTASQVVRWNRYQTSDKFDPDLTKVEWIARQGHETEVALDSDIYHWDCIVNTSRMTADQVYQQVMAHTGDKIR